MDLSAQLTDLAALLSQDVRKRAARVLAHLDREGLRLATAESCTGGLLATLLTDLTGVSHCFECGFVVYSDEAKQRLLGIEDDILARHGAVSAQVATSMAEQALRRCSADLALAVTGFAGPAGADCEEGLVYLALAGKGCISRSREEHFGAIGRDAVRARALDVAVDMLGELMPGSAG